MEVNLYDDLLVELECPICTNYMSPPIRQCATGHSICEICRHKLPKCALCQGQFTDSRNISLEGLAIKMRYPCINKSSGCNAKLSYTERETHELRCSKKGYKCPMEKCPWIGSLEEIANHWASKKMSSKPYNKSNVCHTKMKSESYYVNMVNAYNRLFWFKCKLLNNRLYWAVQLIGTAAESENFYYEIEIIKPGRTKEKILLSNYCQSIELENFQLFKDNGSLFINTDSVNSFVTGDQLIYYMRVSKTKSDFDKGVTALQETQQTRSDSRSEASREHYLKKDKNKQRDRSSGPHTKKNNFRKPPHQPGKPKCKDEFVLL